MSIAGPIVPGLAEILSDEASAFVAMLERRFGAERRRLLAARKAYQARIDAGENPAFRPETRAIRDADWTIAGTPADLADRRVEITGPVDRKMIINALNSGASCFMADFEDAAAPTWEAMIAGQSNLRDAVAPLHRHDRPRRLRQVLQRWRTRPRPSSSARAAGIWKRRISSSTAGPHPRAWSISGSSSSTTQPRLRGDGSGPYVYLPKMEHYEEAALWNAVFVAAQEALRPAARHGQGDGADRDHHRRLRDG